MPVLKMLIYCILAPLTFYCGLLAILWVNQRSMIYYPAPDRQERSAFQAEDMQVVEYPTEDGLTLQAWYKAPVPGKPVIVVFHGNASHMGISAWKVRPYLNEGYGALLPAYRGYAGNPGLPTEQGLYKDARGALRWLIDRQGVAEGDIVLLGESLGSGIAVEMAAASFPDVRAVVLESPYSSFVDLARKHYPFVPFGGLLVRDQYRSIEKIAKVTAPVLIVHGKRDVVVPLELGESLYQAAGQSKEMAVIETAGHNDLYQYGAAQRVLHFLSSSLVADRKSVD